jgi:hypothetical protein
MQECKTEFTDAALIMTKVSLNSMQLYSSMKCLKCMGTVPKKYFPIEPRTLLLMFTGQIIDIRNYRLLMLKLMQPWNCNGVINVDI